MSYKLIALDMDGTLLNSRGVVTEKTRLALRRAMEQGVQVTISTGRSFHGAAKTARELGITCPVMVYNGGMLVDPVTEEILYSKEMLPADAFLAMAEGIQRGVTLIVWSKGKLYGYPLNERTENYRNYAGNTVPLPIESVKDLACLGVTKVLWYGTKEEIPTFWTEMQKKPFACTRICPSQPMFLEFFHGDVSKAAALERLGAMLGISRDEMIAVGDGANDLELLAYAGLGVAMGNASDLVKEKADAVTLSNDQDGVAEVINTWIFGG